MIFWLYGLSGSGKTTLAKKLEEEFNDLVLIDADLFRQTEASDLGYTEEDRMKNIERITQKAQRLNFIDENANIVVAAMTPFSKMRKLVKNKLSESVTFIFIKSDINICMERDPKNIYKNNNINICGLDLPFEENDNEDHIIDTCVKTIEESYHELKNIYLTNKN